MYVTDSQYFNAEKINEKVFIIHLSNGQEIRVEEKPEYNGKVWGWKVDTQIFSMDESALQYLKTLAAEKLTGKRIICHRKMKVPFICGVDGAACRAKGECNTALCDGCPVAEKFFADRDGVELVYAI
jgi:hypothetical protein